MNWPWARNDQIQHATRPSAFLRGFRFFSTKLTLINAISLTRVLMVIMAGALIGGTLAIAFECTMLITMEQRHTRVLARTLIQPSVIREEEIFGIFAALDRLRSPACSQSDLNQLRILVMSSNMLADIARRQNGQLVCSATYGREHALIPALSDPGFVVSPDQTVWRNVELPFVPAHHFLVIAHRDFILFAQTNAPIPSPIDHRIFVSRFFRDVRTGHIAWTEGQPLEVASGLLRDGSTFWSKQRFISVVCLPDGNTCLTLSQTWRSMLHRNALVIFFLTFLGAVVGSGLGVILTTVGHRRKSMHYQLRSAIKRGQLVLVYQPIVSLEGHTLIGAEALMRWKTNSGETISPEIFIPVAEESGLIGELTLLAIRTVSDEFGSFLRLNPNFRVSINIVADDLHSNSFHETLSIYIPQKGISPTQIALELTERRAAQVEASELIIRGLRDIGYKIYIDDFGTGYSSLNYLSDFSIDAIKLDRSFTVAVGTQAARALMVGPIVDMARELGVPVIIEGVETELQASVFEKYGIFAMQGWLYGRPMVASELIKKANSELLKLISEAR